MKFVKSSYKKRLFVLLLLSFGMILTNLSLSLFNSPFLNNNYEEGNIIDYDDQNILPKASDSLPSFNEVGDKINITLHQSYLNNSFNTALSPSDSNNNSFSLPSPRDITFNSTFTNITINNIYAPNKTIEVETNPGSQYSFVVPLYTSFEVQTTCYLNAVNISILAPVGGSTFDFDVFSAKFESGDIKPDADITSGASDLGSVFNDSNSNLWLNLSGLDQLLNVSETYNNVFFIKITASDNFNSFWYSDSNGDDTLSYQNPSGSPLAGVDLTLRVDISPLNNTPKPSEINLKINDDVVTDLDQGSGYWESTKVNGSDSGILKYNITADWWDVICIISKVQINYTKTDLRADSSFEVLGSGQDIYWNVTKSGGLNNFDSRFNNYTINFTISSRWSNVEVWNGGTNKTDDIKTNYLNQYKDIQVFNAGNGTFWFLNATSSNLLMFIKKYVGTSSAADTFNYTDLVRFNGTFSSSINDGSINLSVYNPLTLGDQLNYTFVNSSFISGDDLYFGDWNMSDTITKYGKFRILTQWNNGTDAGFFRDNLTIFAETSLLINQPSQNTVFNSSKIFNITITYDDTGQGLDIYDGDIYYKINAGTYSSVNESVKYIDNGQYNITFDCNNTEFNYGSNTITIRANNTYYHNQTETLDVIILGETSLIRPFPEIYNFDSGETFNITLYFNDTVKNIGIDNADEVDIYVNGSEYIPLSWFDYGNGYYNYTVNCSADIFYGYGSFDMDIYVNKSYYYNQTTSFDIEITGETELKLSVSPERTFYYSNEIFNITAYFKDTARNQGINSSTIEIDVDGNPYTPLSWFDYGNGDYNITLNCSDLIFSNYGSFQIRINASKLHYYESTNSSFELIIGNTTLDVLSPPSNLPYVSGESFNITVYYRDVVKDSGINNAFINYSLDGSTFKNVNVFPIGNGRYNITINVDDADFGSLFGYRTILINASKTNYNNLTKDFIFHRQITTKISPDTFMDLGDVMRGQNVSYTFNYSDTTDKPITQASWSILNNSAGFIGYLQNFENGNYTIHLNTTYVTVSGSFQLFEFNITSTGNQTQEITLRIEVTIIQTQIQDVIRNPLIARNSGLNQTVNFYFNDTTNNQPVLDLTTLDVDVKDFATGFLWDTGDFNWSLLNPLNDGNYILNVSTNGLNSGEYTLQIEVSKYPNYDLSITYVQFYLRGNYTQINMISASDPEEILTPSGIGNNYTTFVGSDLTLEFNVTDTEYGGKAITEVIPGYTIMVTYKNIITELSGTLQQSFSFVFQTADYGTYIGDILSSEFIEAGYYLINITFAKLNYENTTFSFNLTLVNSQINIVLLSNQGGQLEPSGVGNYYNSTVALDLILDFNITDTESLNKAIARDATVYLVKYINLGTGENGTILNSLAFNSPTSKYIGALITSGLGVGNYLINVSVVILNYKIIPLTFNLTIIYANSNLASITNPGGQLPFINNFYDTFIGSNIGIEFNISDVHFETIIQIGVNISYSVYYQNIDTLESGTLQHTLSEIITLHSGSLNISLLPVGNYSFSIIVAKGTNNITSMNFLLRIIEKYETRITVYKPDSVDAGLPFKIIIKAEYFNSVWLPAAGSNINISLYYNSGAGTSQDYDTNSTGEIEITIPTYSDTITLNLTIQLKSAYYHQGYTTEISDIDIIPIPPSFRFEDILPYLIIAAIALAAVGGLFAVYRGLIVPKKREKQRILTEVKTIFDDAINLEHILVLYKGTGTCVFFKSYGSEQIDPELIGGFLSAVSSFGKEMATQEALNEISYGDKMLLLADGALIRVALVLGKNASLILRRHLKEFIGTFEKEYSDILPNWRGQLNPFRNAGIIVDDLLNTSIILPHQISYDFSSVKELKNPHSKEVVKIAQSCCEEAEREFFFIATLLKEVADRTNKDTAEIFMGIKELRDKKILIPIEISAIGAQPVSQQEINLINQKVMALTNLTNEEKQKLVDDLAQLGPIEREAYLSSLAEQQEIVTAPIKTTIGDLSVDNKKAAKKEIKELLKRAKIAQKKKDYVKAVEIYQGAAILASNWELTTEFLKIQETIRKTRIEDLNIKKSNLENEAKIAVKENNYLEAATKYKYASKMASEIFKLGVNEMTKEVKRLTNKAKEYEKMK